MQQTASTTEVTKSLKRPYEDLVRFTVAVPRTYCYFNGGNNDDEDDEKETDHKFYIYQGYKGEILNEIIDKDLKQLGIEGNYNITYRPDGLWGRKSTTLCNGFDVHFAVNHYKDENGKCIFTLKPKNELWYKCIRLTTEEIEAARKVIDEVDKRLCKRLKTVHNL